MANNKRDQKRETKERGSLSVKGNLATMVYHVLPAKKGGWEVRKGGADRATGYFSTKGEAISRAKEISRSSGSELKIHSSDGRTRQSHGTPDELGSAASKTQKSERIEVRTTPSMKALLQRAATFSHKNVTEFMLEAGIKAAEEALLDRRVFRLDNEQWQAFQTMLDRPVTHKPALAKLLSDKSVLE